MYPEEFYEFEQMLEGIDEDLLLQIAGILVFAGLAILLLAVVVYVFQSIGLYTIAKRRGIQNPWLAWLPIGSEWIAGSIADQYRYVVKGEVKNKRKTLLILNIINAVIGLAEIVFFQSHHQARKIPDARKAVHQHTVHILLRGAPEQHPHIRTFRKI